MSRFVALTASALLLSAAAPLGAQDWRQELGKDLVRIEDGKMVMEDVGLLKLTIEGYEPAQFQVRSRAEGPAGGLLSRDNFVAVATMMYTVTLFSVFAEAYQVSASQFLAGYDHTEPPVSMELTLMLAEPRATMWGDRANRC